VIDTAACECDCSAGRSIGAIVRFGHHRHIIPHVFGFCTGISNPRCGVSYVAAHHQLIAPDCFANMALSKRPHAPVIGYRRMRCSGDGMKPATSSFVNYQRIAFTFPEAEQAHSQRLNHVKNALHGAHATNPFHSNCRQKKRDAITHFAQVRQSLSSRLQFLASFLSAPLCRSGLNGQVLVHIVDRFLRTAISIELPIIFVALSNCIDKSLQSGRVMIANEFNPEFPFEGFVQIAIGCS